MAKGIFGVGGGRVASTGRPRPRAAGKRTTSPGTRIPGHVSPGRTALAWPTPPRSPRSRRRHGPTTCSPVHRRGRPCSLVRCSSRPPARSSGSRTSWCSRRPPRPGCSSERSAIFDTLVAFVAFCLAASGTYFLNDAFDVEADRLHAQEALPPDRGGRRPGPHRADRRASCSSSAGIGIGFVTGWKLPVVIATYIVFTTTYSAWLKHVAVVDLGMVAAGLRAPADRRRGRRRRPDLGLVLHRRQLRLAVHGRGQAPRRAPGPRRRAGRAPPDARRSTRSSTSATCGRSRPASRWSAYCLWAFEKSTGTAGVPWYELSIVPFVLAILRYALLVERGEGGAPEEIVLHDRPLQIMGVLWVITRRDRPLCRLTRSPRSRATTGSSTGWGGTAPSRAPARHAARRRRRRAGCSGGAAARRRSRAASAARTATRRRTPAAWCSTPPR